MYTKINSHTLEVRGKNQARYLDHTKLEKNPPKNKKKKNKKYAQETTKPNPKPPADKIGRSEIMEIMFLCNKI